MKNDTIVLSTDEELKIVMSPIRQKIMKLMAMEGKPVTSKYIADKLNMSPSSSAHHIQKLQQIGIIEIDHTEVVNGITAKYLKQTEKTISIGQQLNDSLSSERDILAKNMLFETYNRFESLVKAKRDSSKDKWNEKDKLADVVSGVVHLTEEESNELYDLIHTFIKNHSKAGKNTHPYDFAVIAYRADLDTSEKGKES